MTWTQIPGWFDWEDFYQEIVNRYPGGTLVEVGCYLGRSLCFLGDAVKRSRKPFKVLGVDTCVGSGPEVYPSGEIVDNHEDALHRGGGTFVGELHRNVMACGLQDVVTLIVGDSVRVSEMFADLSLTMVFLDGRHDYEGVGSDIVAWKPKVAVGGVLAGDDYCDVWPGVQRAVRETCLGHTPVSHDSWEWRKT